MADVDEACLLGREEGSAAELWPFISPYYSCDESLLLSEMGKRIQPTELELRQVQALTERLIGGVRELPQSQSPLDALLLEYSLSTHEGILLMSLAEALLRIPDSATQDDFIRDKLSQANWSAHTGQSDSWWVNASTLGLLLTDRLILPTESPGPWLRQLVGRLSEPVVRQVLQQAMQVMGDHFVLGQDIHQALRQSQKQKTVGDYYSFDMLGEAALTERDADAFFHAYSGAIDALGQAQDAASIGPLNNSVSIKLSALHPRYEIGQLARLEQELLPRLYQLIQQARELNVSLTIDAEEADRLELSLLLFERLYRHRHCCGWGGLGLAVQAYSKRALPVLYWLRGLAQEQGDLIPVRLVKGAYWDTEIKLAQQKGVSSYPVYTSKPATDLSYLACAQMLFEPVSVGRLYPQFATHNAQTISAVLGYAHSCSWVRDCGFEFQRLHGMGETLYQQFRRHSRVSVRVYAPVGAHRELLPYLVRRLLENGANSSFVHQIQDPSVPLEQLSEHPVEGIKHSRAATFHAQSSPRQLFSPERQNSQGLNLNIESQWQLFCALTAPFRETFWQAAPIIDGQPCMSGSCQPTGAPYNPSEKVGECFLSDAGMISKALCSVQAGFPGWRDTPVELRSDCLERWADLIEAHRGELYELCQREAGKTLNDAVDEVREAVDFCRYYAAQAKAQLKHPKRLQGPGGIEKQCRLEGLGVVVCISPWNFPLAIFVGQVAAALVAGNSVIAKPATQTALIAMRAIELLLESGLPASAVALLPGSGTQIGEILLTAPQVKGVAFTGSTHTAREINRLLAQRDCEPAVLIAETGGQNVMLVDSTALPEQVVRAAMESAFSSAGQRCSALRVLFLQEECAAQIEELLAGALLQLQVGDPRLRSTDVGPVINASAQAALLAHAHQLEAQGRLVAKAGLPQSAVEGYFVAPSIFQLHSILELEQEHFGPLLHIVRYRREELSTVLDEINATGFGLTFGVQSRSESLANLVSERVRAGNVYVNRNQIGAVVGAQPFGGMGLSGTGPKAGGPHYLLRFTQECIL